jgi:hypothetical protein|tara:strand:- start:609 stop:857 length:249 start_codon:yes stop_codon:yes gene_type:complete
MILSGNKYVSKCSRYSITNEGKKGGESYVLWTNDYTGTDTPREWTSHCCLVALGTLKHCMETYDEIKSRKEKENQEKENKEG